MYGVFQSRSQGPLSSSLARVVMENWIFSEVLELHASQSFKIVMIKVCWSLTEMSVGDKRTAEAIEGSCGRILVKRSHRLINTYSSIVTLIEEFMLGLIKACVNDKYLHADSETRWENELEVSGQHYRKEEDKSDLNSRISVVESNFRYRVYGNFSNWFVLKRISVDICLFDRCKTEANHDFVAFVVPRLRQFACFYF